MQYSITQKVRIAFFIALFFIFAISFLAFVSISQLVETSRLVDNTHSMVFHLGQLHVAVKEAETAQRAYLLTSDSSFYNSYQNWKEASEKQKIVVAGIMENYPNQQENFKELERLIDVRFRRLESIISLHQQSRAFSLEVSNKTMNSLRAVILRMQEEEDQVLDNRRGQEQLYARQALLFILLFSLVSLILITFAFFRIRRDVRGRQKAEGKLAENNLQLEEMVAERTFEIRKNEERYRFMAESIPHVVWTADVRGEMDFFSQKLALYTGKPAEEMLGLQWISLLHPDDVRLAMEAREKALVNGMEARIQHRLLGKDGVYRWVDTRGVPYRDRNENIVKWFGTTTLIDDEVKAKEAAHQQEELLRDVTDSLPVLISFMDKEFRYQFVNKTYEKWFLKTREEILNQYAWDVIGKTGFEKIKSYLELAFTGQKVSSEVETYYDHLGKRYIRFNFVPRFENDKVIGAYLLVTDVSEVKKIENELRNALLDAEVKNVELKRINLVLDDFVSMAAHDLKSPVSNLKLSVLLFKKLKDDKDRLTVISHLEDSVKRLDKTLSGLLEIVEVQHVKGAKVVLCQFREVLEEATMSLHDKLREAGGELISNFERAPSLYYIKPYLVSILSNLISNAIKYREENRPLLVEVFTELQEDGVVLSCKDNGIGMDLDKIGEKLFKPFKRFSSQAEGTGVGLHLIKSIIERNGGRICVNSKPGEGTTFTCFLKNIRINDVEL